VIGKNPRIFKSGKQPLVFYQNLFSQISSGKTWQGKLTNKKKDGSLVEERMVISPVINEKGIIEYYIAIKQDVTVESQMEKELRQAEKMQAIGTLAGGIAHDFNNILQIIQIYNDLLISDTSENDRMLRNAGEINNAVHRGKDLVHAILTYTSQTDVELNVQPLEPLIRESLAFIKAMLPTAVSISEHLTPVGEILCNSTNIQQIIMNLVNNASFAMDYKGRISISLTRVSRPVLKGKTHSGEWAMLQIADPGKGMSPEIQHRVFEPFFTTKKTGEGSGLGLSTVLGIIEKHNGFIDLNSILGKGTIVTVILPIYKVSNEE
jgi:signal transduction histidine kinase